MAELLLLALFHEATPTSDTIDELRKLGVSDEGITVMSGIPYQPEMLGRRYTYERLIPTALIGALGGFLTGVFLTVGTPLLYSISVGGQPIVPLPPALIILFELTMLGTILATFAGILAESQFPTMGRDAYDFRITEGHIGLLLRIDEPLADQAEDILKAHGAHHLQRLAMRQPVGRRRWARWALIIVFPFVPTAIVLLLAYAVITLPLPDQMAEQISIGYEQGPRLAAPSAAIPVQGADLLADEPASEPIPATGNSIQRGRILFDINCAMCHGQDGAGNGSLSHYFSPPPANLTSNTTQRLSNAELFLVITQGHDPMPSLAENLNPGERWDVINYVRTLKE